MVEAAFFRLHVTCYGRGDFGAIGRAAYVAGDRLEQVDPVALAAYRAGEKLDRRGTGQVADFRRRSGVVASWSSAPAGAPDWTKDTALTWSMVDLAETRKNSRVARDITVSWPHQMSAEGRSRVSHDLGDWLAERFNTVVQCALHEPEKKTADRRNFHSHYLAATRELRADGQGFGRKIRELDDRKTGPKAIAEIRVKAADLINLQLARDGLELAVEHRSVRRQATEIRAKDARTDRKRTVELTSQDRVVRLQALEQWRAEDLDRQYQQPPMAWTRTTRLLALERDQREVSAETAGLAHEKSEKIGRKLLPREVRRIRQAVTKRRDAAMKAAYPPTYWTREQIHAARVKARSEDLAAQIAKPARIDELEAEIRARGHVWRDAAERIETGRPLQEQMARMSELIARSRAAERGIEHGRN